MEPRDPVRFHQEMQTKRKLTIALDETRMLMMGSQILFGFQFESVFQKGFAVLSATARGLEAASLLLMALCVGLLIAGPSLHRLAESGEANDRILKAVTGLTGAALIPLALSLGSDLVTVLERMLGPAAAWTTGILMVCAALGAWYGAGFALRPQQRKEQEMERHRSEKVDLVTKIEQMLTEARVILPGAQAMLGFQFIVMLTPAFAELPSEARTIHVIALICGALTVILLMAPAAIHRIAYRGEASTRMLAIGAALVTCALLPLGLAISADVYVALGRVAGDRMIGGIGAAGTLIVLLAIWYAWPWAMRGTHDFQREALQR